MSKRACIVCGARAKRPQCSFDYDCALCKACDESLAGLANETGHSVFEDDVVPVLIEWAAKRARASRAEEGK